MEYLDVVDEQGLPTGQIVPRLRAHREGLRHRTAHVWLYRIKSGKVQLLLQKRSAQKDSHPGCFDISSAGHIPAGQDFIPSALRELQEELGVQAAPEQLQFCGVRSFAYDGVFYGKEFHDNQVSRVYVLHCDKESTAFTLQQEELESVCWVDLDDCLRMVQENRVPNCIALEELHMVQAALQA